MTNSVDPVQTGVCPKTYVYMYYSTLVLDLQFIYNLPF